MDSAPVYSSYSVITAPHLLFLGTSDSKGVPRLGCLCNVCRTAFRGSRNFRTRASLFLSCLSGSVLIDTPPELRVRFAEEALPLPDALLLTHPHDDHILGFSDAVNASRQAESPFPIYAPPAVLAGLRERFGYLWSDERWRRGMRVRELEERIFVGEWALEPVRVNHGFNGWAYGYLVERQGWRMGYFPDAIRVDEVVLERWSGLDLLILGTNYWREEAPQDTRSVYDVEEALEIAEKMSVKQLVLTHLSHGIDFDSVSVRLPAWASLAWDGRRVHAT